MQAQPTAPLTPGREPYDAIVVGSGAAGGMAAFQLAMSGIKVLLLEAGRMLDPQKEYKTMEWPYKDMRRHRLPVGEFALAAAEYRTLDRPYGLTPEMQSSVTNSFGQTHDVKNLFVVDGSIFVSASCQNPTWMIMALCWRAMDYVKDEMKRGNL